jgi:hypothetical protein
MSGDLGYRSVGAVLPVQPCDVSTILRPIRSNLVAHEIVTTEHLDPQTVSVNGQTTGPGVVENNSIDAGQDVDPPCAASA